MKNVIRFRRLNFFFAVLPAGMVFSLLFFLPYNGLSQTPKFTAHSSPNANLILAHGDLNGDGYEDFIMQSVVGQSIDHTFGVVLSNGNGTYRAPTTYTLPQGLNGTGYTALGDLNGDGKLDLVVPTLPTLGFLIYFGNGDGTFRAPVNHSSDRQLWGVATADVNHDGKIDLLLDTTAPSDLTDNELEVLFGNGDGTFTVGPVTGGLEEYPDTLLTGDFNGDGNVDAVVASSYFDFGTLFTVVSGDGTGNFEITYFYDGGNFFRLVAADVNGDGISDLISGTNIGQNADPYLTVYYGAPNRVMQFAEIPTARCAVWGNVTQDPIAVADFNGDHIPDLAFSDTECGGTNATRITILSGKGNNEFGSETPVANVTSEAGALFAVGNLFALRSNRDTRPDLLFDTTAYVTLLNTTTGSFPTCAAPNAVAGIAQCSPVSGSTLNSPVNFAIGAAAGEPIRKIELWADGKKQLEQFAGAFSNYGFLNASVPLAAGSHRINIITSGWDNSQQSKVSTITVMASSSCSAPASAGVHICSPTSGASVSSPVVVTATSKVTGTIVSTQLWVDGVKNFNAPGSTTLTTSVSLKAGSHRFAVIATNTTGQKWESAVNATVK